MIAFAPSYRRSRWRSRNAGCPPRMRSPSQTPSPRTNPESKTDTTARSRGTRSPLTQIRMSSLRGSSSKSWVPCAMHGSLWAACVLQPHGAGVVGADVVDLEAELQDLGRVAEQPQAGACRDGGEA